MPMRLTGKFSVACGGDVHAIEITEGGAAISVGGHHDFDLERSLVVLGGEPSDCMRFVLEHGDVLTSALESILLELFSLVFDDDQGEIHYGEATKTGIELPKTVYNADMEITDGVMNSVGISDDDRYRIEQEAQELGLEFDPPFGGHIYAPHGIVMAGELALSGDPNLQDVVPGDAIVLAEGTNRHHVLSENYSDQYASVFVEENWVRHGAVEEAEWDEGEEVATVEFYYKWAVYTTQEVVRDKRREKLEEFIGEQFERIDGWLNEAEEFAEEKKCESAFGALAEEVYPAYAALDERLRDPDAEEDVLSWRHHDVEYHHKIVNLDLAQLAEIEHKCGVRRPDIERRSTNAVLEFFQKVYNASKKTDEASDILVASLAEDEE